jgi:hypothetical protein
MNLNNYKNIKLNILRDYLKAKFSNQPYNVKERFNLFTKEFESENQNINYRSSSPWEVLIKAAQQFDSIPESKANDLFLCGFKYEDQQYQRIADASVSKAIICLAYTGLGDSELIHKIRTYILDNRLQKNSLSNFVRRMKNIHPELLSGD